MYKMLESLNRQKDVDFQVLVIDQSEFLPENKVDTILKSCKNVKYFQIDTRGRSLSKNFAMDKVAGNIILFCDDDIVAEENFLWEHQKVHEEHPDVGAVSCHLIEPHEKVVECRMPLKITTYGRFVNVPNASFNGFVTSLNGGNMSFKRSALQKVGYFEENLIGTSMLEEPDIAYRILKKKYRIYFSSNTRVRHYPQYNGNIQTKKGKNYDWQKDYYFNQYFFMFRNERKKYFPLIFIYLTYRAFIELCKNKSFSWKYLCLPLTSFWLAYNSWKEKQANYPLRWYTPQRTAVKTLKYISN